MNEVDISEETRNEFLNDFRKKLNENIAKKKELETSITSVESKINDYRQLIALFGSSEYDLEDSYAKDLEEVSGENITDINSNNEKKKTWDQKIITILDNPSKYDLSIYNGMDDIFKAIAIEFSEPIENKDKVKRTLSPTVSRLIKDGSIIKVRKIGTKGDFYQVSPNWFTEVDGIKKPLPEYEEILRDYEIAAE